LHAVADAAEDGDRADIGKTGEVAERGFDLSGEFARRLEDEHASATVRAEAREDGQAAVLPVPVWAVPSTSRPSRAGGIACC